MTPWVREGIPLHRWLIWVFVWVVLRLTLASVLRIKFKGQERIPKSGGAMMLANHTTLWDPLMCFWGVNRPPHGIGSEQVFRIPVVGWVLRQLNSVPYAKGAKDAAAALSGLGPSSRSLTSLRTRCTRLRLTTAT